MEYIYVDDALTDNTLNELHSVLEDYPNRRKETHIINMPNNSGKVAVSLKGIEEATGDNIIHCDGDDWVESKMYEEMYNTAMDGNYDVVSCDYCEVAPDGIVARHLIVNDDKDSYIKDLIMGVSHGSICFRMVKKSIVKRKDIIEPVEHAIEDLVLTIQYVYYSSK